MNIIVEVLVLLVKITLGYVEAFVHLFYTPKKEIAGRTAVLTGGGGGIGQCIALELVQRKVKLALWDVNKAAVDSVRDGLSQQGFSNVFAYQCDITNPEEVKRVADETRKDLGEIDFLFNNAGVLAARDILDLSKDEIRRTFDVNIISQFWTIQEFLPSMLKKNYGHIINTASLAGKVGAGLMSDYCASKFAVVGMSESLRYDIERRGKDVKVTDICPNIVNTPMVSNTEDHCVPHSRFEKFLVPAACARLIVQGMERNYATVYAPSNVCVVAFAMPLLPQKVKSLLSNFLQIGYFPKDYKLK